MGVAPNKTFTFDGVSSSTYGVYLTGEGVFNAPQRSVDMIEIPGRNGSFALDHGRYSNISVTYKVGMYDVNESNFATKVANFRNWLCSKVGYKKLTDEYNPNEYRMALYASGFELDHDLLIAGEAEITFDCKPQRWLTSGESDITATNNGTITNPTLYPSSPLLKLVGYGNVSFNGYTVSVENSVMGQLLLANSSTFSSNSKDIIFNKLAYETGDTITLGAGNIEWDVSLINGYTFWPPPYSIEVTDSNNSFSSSGRSGSLAMYFNTTRPAITFTAGTNKTVTNTATSTFPIGQTHDTRSDVTVTCVQTITYTANYSSTQSKIEIKYALSYSQAGCMDYKFYGASSKTGDVTVNSTQSLLGNPTYIDCDLGEAYKITSGVYVSLNSKITLGSRLPTLASGNNTITFSNTFTSVKMEPRWWKL